MSDLIEIRAGLRDRLEVVERLLKRLQEALSGDPKKRMNTLTEQPETTRDLMEQLSELLMDWEALRQQILAEDVARQRKAT